MILGVTGTNGAGKGAVVDYLASEKGFAHYSVRDLIIEEVKRRGLELNRINIGETGTALRREHGSGYFVGEFMRRAQKAGQRDVVIESIRTLAEADALRKVGGFMVGVNAPEALRFERVMGRGSVTDRVTFEQFREQEDREYRPKDLNDPTQMNVLGVLESADYSVINDSTLEELHQRVDKILEEIRTA